MRIRGGWKVLGLVCAGVGLVAGGLAATAAVNGARFGRRVAADARELFALRTEAPPRPIDPESLPPPVRRYLARAGVLGRAPIRTVRLVHGGTFVTGPGKPGLPIRGEQYLAADPPGFVWWGRIRAAPGLTIEARDRSRAGEGNMWIVLASTFTLQDARGPELDQGALLRLLGELTWCPTALLDGRYVSWEPVDADHARATLRVGGREVSATFEFGADGMPARFTAERFRDVDGTPVLTPFVGRSEDYRLVDGVRVPFRLVAAWVIEGGTLEYARWEVERVELDRPEPF